MALSAAGALVLVFEPGLQFLGFTGAPSVIYMGIAWLATRRILLETRPWAIGAAALVLGWAGTCFAVELYPPFQVGLAYLYACLVAGLCAERSVRATLRTRRGARVAALAAAGLFALASVTFLMGLAHLVYPTTFVLYADYRYDWGLKMVGWTLLIVGALVSGAV